MEFKKKLVIYASILGGLLVLFVIGSLVSLAGVTPQGEKIFPALSAAAVAKVKIADKAGVLELIKADTGWKLTVRGRTYVAAKDVVDTLIKNVEALHKKSTAGSAKDSWETFSVDDASAIRITLLDQAGAVQADCFFGKGGSTSLSQYVRLPSADAVIQADGRIDKTTLLKDWVERRLFPDFLVDDVAKVTIKTTLVFNDNAEASRRSLGYTLVQGEKDKEGINTWKLLENDRVPLTGATVNGFVSGLSRFSAENVVEDPAPLKLDPARPLGTAVLTMKSGSTYTLLLLGASAAEANTFYVTNQENKYLYTATNWALKDAFRAGIDSFIDTKAYASQLLNPQGSK
jgi:hypothetical protein